MTDVYVLTLNEEAIELDDKSYQNSEILGVHTSEEGAKSQIMREITERQISAYYFDIEKHEIN